MNFLNLPKEIIVTEVGPRDGLQNEKIILSVEQKVDLIEQAVDAGAKIIEIGSFVHPKAIPQLADTDAVAEKIKRVDGVEYRALIMNLKGIERAHNVSVTKTKFTVSASVSHSLSNMRRTPEEVIETLKPCAEFAAKNNIVLSGAIPTAFGCPFEGNIPLESVIAIIKQFIALGVKEISLSDTTGMAHPKLVYDYCTKLSEMFPDIIWNLHFHNTRGMALANILAGMAAGFTRYDSCFAGTGGCPFAPGASGNIATEDVLHMLHEMGVETGYDLDKTINLAKKVEKLIGRETPSFILRAGKSSELHEMKKD